MALMLMGTLSVERSAVTTSRRSDGLSWGKACGISTGTPSKIM